MADTISVVIPSYNHSAFIGQAIESVLDQTLLPQELVIIDDGSTDGSPDIIESYRKQVEKQKIRLITQYRENRGAHQTLNESIERASSKWISILNSDDFYAPQRFSRLLKEAKKQNSLLAISLVRHIDAKGQALPDWHPFRSWYVREMSIERKKFAFRFLFHNIGITTGNLFMTKNLWERVGKFRNFRMIHDYDFFLRSLNLTSIAFVEEDLLNYRLHSTNTIHEAHEVENIEGAEMVRHVLQDLMLKKEKPHSEAPWSPKNRREFLDYWRNSPEGAVKYWLGGVDLSDCFQSQED
jgi:glycosyltransferase involved in cell wall biosynthesis